MISSKSHRHPGTVRTKFSWFSWFLHFLGFLDFQSNSLPISHISILSSLSSPQLYQLSRWALLNLNSTLWTLYISKQYLSSLNYVPFSYSSIWKIDPLPKTDIKGVCVHVHIHVCYVCFMYACAHWGWTVYPSAHNNHIIRPSQSLKGYIIMICFSRHSF